MAIREDETAAAAMGVDRVRLKLLAFATGAGFAGMAGTFYVSKLQTATPEMFGFPVSVMILVMIVLGGLGSVWGAVLGAVVLSLLQSWWLPDLTEWLHALGDATGIAWLTQVELAPATELIFGIILVLMMLYRREGLIPATRKQAALAVEQQHAEVRGVARCGLAPRQRRQPDARPRSRSRMSSCGSAASLRSARSASPCRRAAWSRVIGPNGSGKSTLFNAVTGLTQANGGRVRLFGADITGLKPHRILERGIARTFQNIRLFPNLTVLENVLIGGHARLRTGAIRAVLRPPSTRAEERAAREHAAEILGAVRQPAAAAPGSAGTRALLRQPPPRRNRARARLASARAAARRADGGHEPGRDARTCGARSARCTRAG